MFRKRLKNQKGFTLIELLVVVAIIGILAAVLAPSVFQATLDAKVAAVQADIEAMKAAAILYHSDTGVWPLNQENTSSRDPGLVTAPTPAVLGWDGPYLERWKTHNPWKGLYTWSDDNDTLVFIGLGAMPDEAAQRLEEIYDGDTELDAIGIIRQGEPWKFAFIIAGD